MLLAFAGLPGTGKSTLARAVAKSSNAIGLGEDLIEAALLKAGLSRSFETGLAAYITARDLAADHLQLGRNVVIDAVNGIEPGRAMWRSLASESGASLFFVETICSDRTEHQRRVESRTAPTPPLPLPTWSEVVRREYTVWKDPVLVIDTVEPIDECTAKIMSHISGVLLPTFGGSNGILDI